MSIRRKKIITSVYLTKGQKESLERLHKRTRIDVAKLIREGVDDLLKKYSEPCDPEEEDEEEEIDEGGPR